MYRTNNVVFTPNPNLAIIEDLKQNCYFEKVEENGHWLSTGIDLSEYKHHDLLNSFYNINKHTDLILKDVVSDTYIISGLGVKDNILYLRFDDRTINHMYGTSENFPDGVDTKYGYSVSDQIVYTGLAPLRATGFKFVVIK